MNNRKRNKYEKNEYMSLPLEKTDLLIENIHNLKNCLNSYRKELQEKNKYINDVKLRLSFYECLFRNVNIVWKIFNSDLLALIKGNIEAKENEAHNTGRQKEKENGRDERCELDLDDNGNDKSKCSDKHNHDDDYSNSDDYNYYDNDDICDWGNNLAQSPYYNIDNFQELFLKYVSINSTENDEDDVHFLKSISREEEEEEERQTMIVNRKKRIKLNSDHLVNERKFIKSENVKGSIEKTELYNKCVNSTRKDKEKKSGKMPQQGTVKKEQKWGEEIKEEHEEREIKAYRGEGEIKVYGDKGEKYTKDTVRGDKLIHVKKENLGEEEEEGGTEKGGDEEGETEKGGDKEGENKGEKEKEKNKERKKNDYNKVSDKNTMNKGRRGSVGSTNDRNSEKKIHLSSQEKINFECGVATTSSSATAATDGVTSPPSDRLSRKVVSGKNHSSRGKYEGKDDKEKDEDKFEDRDEDKDEGKNEDIDGGIDEDMDVDKTDKVIRKAKGKREKCDHHVDDDMTIHNNSKNNFEDRLQTSFLKNMKRTLGFLNKLMEVKNIDVKYNIEHERKINYEKSVYYEKYMEEKKKRNELQNNYDILKVEVDRLEKKKASLLFKVYNENICKNIIEEGKINNLEDTINSDFNVENVDNFEEKNKITCINCGYSNFLDKDICKNVNADIVVIGGTGKGGENINRRSNTSGGIDDSRYYKSDSKVLFNFEKIITRDKIINSEPFKNLINESSEIHKILKAKENEILLLKKEIIKMERIQDEEYESLLTDTINNKKDLTKKIKDLEIDIVTYKLDKEKMKNKVDIQEYEISVLKSIEKNQSMQLQQKENEIMKMKVQLDRLKISENNLKQKLELLEGEKDRLFGYAVDGIIQGEGIQNNQFVSNGKQSGCLDSFEQRSCMGAIESVMKKGSVIPVSEKLHEESRLGECTHNSAIEKNVDKEEGREIIPLQFEKNGEECKLLGVEVNGEVDAIALNKRTETIEVSERNDIHIDISKYRELVQENTNLRRNLEKKKNVENELSSLRKNYDAMSEEIEEITKEFEKKQEQIDEMIVQIKNKELESLEKHSNMMNKVYIEENLKQLENSYQEKMLCINRIYEKYENFVNFYLTLFYHARKSAIIADSAREEQMGVFVKLKEKYEFVFQQKNEVNDLLKKVYSCNKKLIDQCNNLYKENQNLQHTLLYNQRNVTKDGPSKEDRHILVEENNELRRRLICSVCMENFRNYVIIKCGHIYCENCIFSNLKTRNRKCPQCKIPFDKKDLQKIFLD
ncbi:trophozoite exported protein 1 [Plasmodium brasilianum]|uniref:Trophozoite exported protein 1 n=2 Tax=Plasmodium (Plasmodium) TaxID=418103 RepID=A0ACB9Y854_PLABR|nr:trophozoite exported protein 1 [Plasmodium brasilianum]SBS87522.1 trophozoite exported protein 1, putative (TEX1) [Plasmodium malariae]